jgi:hypothetical protein
VTRAYVSGDPIVVGETHCLLIDDGPATAMLSRVLNSSLEVSSIIVVLSSLPCVVRSLG